MVMPIVVLLITPAMKKPESIIVKNHVRVVRMETTEIGSAADQSRSKTRLPVEINPQHTMTEVGGAR